MTNLFLMMLLAMGQPVPGPGIGERASLERIQGPTPVTDKFLLPPKLADCRNQEEADKAIAERRAGEMESCDPERYLRRR